MPVLSTTAGEVAELFDASPAPVYLVDDRRRIVYVNSACCKWLGLKAADLLKQRCAFHAPAEAQGPAAAANALCPPPSCFRGQHCEAVVAWRSADGAARYRRARFLALDDGSDESSPVLAILDRADCAPPPLCDVADVASSDAQLHERLVQFRVQMAGRYRVDSLIGISPQIMKARAQVELATRVRSHVLLTGPAGVGKDHAAKAMHYGQPRAGTLVPLSCSVLESNLLRSTLRAAWTRTSAGETSTTLLLEDIDAMPADAQVDLLEMLRAEQPRLRVLATSTRSISQLAAVEGLSAELMSRISTITLELPPLVERLADLPLLAQAFLEESNLLSERQIGGFSSAALDALADYHWPQNVDELAEVVRQSHARSTGGEITPSDLPGRLHHAAGTAASRPKGPETIVLEDFLAQVERELIERALQRAKGNKSKAARLLGMTRPRLYRRLVQLGLAPADEAETADE